MARDILITLLLLASVAPPALAAHAGAPEEVVPQGALRSSQHETGARPDLALLADLPNGREPRGPPAEAQPAPAPAPSAPSPAPTPAPTDPQPDAPAVVIPTPVIVLDAPPAPTGAVSSPQPAESPGSALPENAPDKDPTPTTEDSSSPSMSSAPQERTMDGPARTAEPGGPASPSDLTAELAGTSASGAALARGPSVLPAPQEAASGDGAAWAARIAWALSLLGVGGIGAVLMLRRRPAPAAPMMAQAARLTPVSAEDVPALLLNGRAAAARGANEEAILWFDRALRVAPGLAVAHFCKGVCLAGEGRAAEAYSALRRAVEAAPDDASYRIHLANAALTIHRTREAMEHLGVVLSALPDVGPELLEDPGFKALRDHPVFLAMCGAL